MPAQVHIDFLSHIYSIGLPTLVPWRRGLVIESSQLARKEREGRGKLNLARVENIPNVVLVRQKLDVECSESKASSSPLRRQGVEQDPTHLL